MPGETGHSEIQRLTPGGHPAAAPNASQPPQAEPSYYDISFLQEPPWKWEIAGYFFFGGLTAGAYVLSRMADRFGGKAGREVARTGAWVAMATLLPCPPLLIKDLGDPKRFHHMLRLLKPGSPMSLGSWIISGYSLFVTMNLGRQIAHDRGLLGNRNGLLLRVADAMVNNANDLAGVPLAVMLAGYTGVLLSCSANPLWAQNPWIGPLFSASAASTGAAAISAAMTLTGGDPQSPAARAIEKFDTVAHAAEAATFIGFVQHQPDAARPLTRGPMRNHMIIFGGLLVAAEVLKHINVSRNARKYTSVAAAAAGLAAGLHLRWAFVYGGHTAAADPRAARASSRSPRRAKPARFPYPPQR